MDSTLRMQLQIARTGQYGDIMRTALIGLAVISAIVGFGAEGIDIPLIILTIAVAAFGVLGGGTALDDIAKLRDDMDEATGTSAYGTQAKSRKLGLLKNVSATLLGLTALTLIIAIFM